MIRCPGVVRVRACGSTRLEVIARNTRTSAFDGWRTMPSPRSCVRCLACGRAWRTYADVSHLPNAGASS